jgi:nitroreductase
MEFKTMVQKRRSIRKFSEEELTSDELKLILRAALMSPTSKSCRSWKFIVVDDKDMLYKLSRCKAAGAEFIENAPLAIVVLGNAADDDVWIEDASIAAISMQYQATELGLGSCWAQIRGRKMPDGVDSDDILRMMLGYSEEYKTLCIVAFGHPAVERKLQDESKLKWENVEIYKPLS